MANLYSDVTLSILRRATALATLVALTLGSPPAAAQTATRTAINAPGTGDVLQGSVNIRGTVSAQSFLSAELAFAYANDPSNTWFTFAEGLQPGVDVELAIWDTRVISDGDYLLRLRLNTLDGTVEDAMIDVQVRNYTSASVPLPVPTLTDRPSLQLETPISVRATPTLVRVDPSTPTPLPANTASLSPTTVFGGFSRGAMAIAAAFLIVGVLLIRRRR